MNPKIEEFVIRREKAMLGGGQARIQKQHERGKLTARERIDLLMDPDTFVEYGMFVSSRGHEFGMEKQYTPADGVITGFGKVNGRTVYVYANDVTVMGGSLGEMTGYKIVRVMNEAIHAGAPIVALNECGGGRIQEGNDTKWFLDIFCTNTRASGYVPQLSAIMGASAGGAAYSPAITDFIIMVKNTSRMFLTGPKVIAEVTGETITDEALGGSSVHCTQSGVAHREARDDRDCIAQLQQVLSYLPPNCNEAPPIYQCVDPLDRLAPELDTLIPDNPRKAFDVRAVIWAITDQRDFYEIQPDYACNIVVGFGRMAGRSIGFIANQPTVLAGSLDIDASDKAAHFINWCDSFGIPLVFISDTPGYMPGVSQEHGGIIRHGAKMVYAVANATVPKIALNIRKIYGGACAAMCEKGMNPDAVVCWPTAESAVMGASGAASIIFHREIDAAKNPEQRRAELIANYESAFNNPYRKAAREYTDIVIRPSETRWVLIRLLDALKNKHVESLPKKHGNMPV